MLLKDFGVFMTTMLGYGSFQFKGGVMGEEPYRDEDGKPVYMLRTTEHRKRGYILPKLEKARELFEQHMGVGTIDWDADFPDDEDLFS
jgi:hypothetical protein